MIASLTGEHAYPLLIPLLTSTPPCQPSAHDVDGNTALHHAAAAGHTKALRTLLEFGASPLAQNAYSWTPVAYSASKQLELYFRDLVGDLERKRVEGMKEEKEKEKEQRRRGVGGVRLVTDFEGSDNASVVGVGVGGSGQASDGMRTPTSAISKRDAAQWSPIERWRSTPTRDEWPASATTTGSRSRAWSGD